MIVGLTCLHQLVSVEENSLYTELGISVGNKSDFAMKVVIYM